MYPSRQQIIRWLDRLAPRDWAEEWDNTGLQIGSVDGGTKAVYVTLTVSEAGVREARKLGCGMIISHHPVFFKSIKRLETSKSSGETGKIVRECLKDDITVYACHTNLDAAPGGINDALIRAIGLHPEGQQGEYETLKTVGTIPFYKLVVFVPVSHLEHVRRALASEGAGSLGNYSECAFWVEGTGAFMPNEGAEPFTGTVGALELVDEVKLEAIIRGDTLNVVVKAMLQVHPYEVPAYDVYKLENLGISYGLGRVGVLDKPIALAELAETVKTSLGIKTVRTVGELQHKVRKIAVCGGAGGDLIYNAVRKADVLVTGDIRYHEALTALEHGLCIIDAGHFETEKPGVIMLADYLRDKAELGQFELDVYVDNSDITPFSTV